MGNLYGLSVEEGSVFMLNCEECSMGMDSKKNKYKVLHLILGHCLKIPR